MYANYVLIIICVLLTKERREFFEHNLSGIQSMVGIRNEYFPGLDKLYHSIQTLLNSVLWTPQKVSQLWLQFITGSLC